MPLALFTTLALAMPCHCELVGLNDSLDAFVHLDWSQSRQVLAEGGGAHAVGRGSVMQVLGEDVRSHHRPLIDLPPSAFSHLHAGAIETPGAQVSEWPALERRTFEWRTFERSSEKARKVLFPNVPTVLTPLARAENSLMAAPFAAAIAAEEEEVRTNAEKAELDEGVFLVDAVPADAILVDTVEADALVSDNLEIGVEAVIPPPVPIEEIRSDLLEVLGLDSQVPDPPAPQPREVPPWAATIYGGRFISDDLGPALIGNLTGFEDSMLVGFGLARTLAGRRPLSLEAEGQILQHFGNQGHSEGTVALVLRWHDFPWDDKIDTTFAIGEGLSFATSVPELEVRRNGRSTQLLNYLLFELTFALPQEPDWQFVGRLHHRSGVYGLFDGVGSGSNIYSAGIRRRF